MSTENESMFGGSMWIFALLILLLIGGGGFGRGEFNSAAQSEILIGQQFQNIDNKIDRIGNGIADATFALNNSVHSVQDNLGASIGDMKLNMANYACSIKEAVHGEGEATRAMIQQNKIESLQQKVSQLELQSAMCGVVRYPMANVYTSGAGPFCGCGGCNGNAF